MKKRIYCEGSVDDHHDGCNDDDEVIMSRLEARRRRLATLRSHYPFVATFFEPLSSLFYPAIPSAIVATVAFPG
jgi:hypothetical protein